MWFFFLVCILIAGVALGISAIVVAGLFIFGVVSYIVYQQTSMYKPIFLLFPKRILDIIIICMFFVLTYDCNSTKAKQENASTQRY